MLHLRYLHFVDEIGSNTIAETYKTQNERRVCHRDDKPQQVSSPFYHHCTIILFTNALDEHVCCVIIIAGDSNSVHYTLGIDYCNIGKKLLDKESAEEEMISFSQNNISGNNKIFPRGMYVMLIGKYYPHLRCVPYLVVYV